MRPRRAQVARELDAEHAQAARDHDAHRPMIAADGCRRRRCRADGLADRRRVRARRQSRALPRAPSRRRPRARRRRRSPRSCASACATRPRPRRPRRASRRRRARRVDRCDLVVESVPEDLALKGEVLSPIAAHFPDAVIASNTSSLSIGEIGEACGAPERTVGTHYWNPPLLMPLVEVIAGPDTRPRQWSWRARPSRAAASDRCCVQRDVPGFIWNRLQHALLREALWIIDNGVATPEAVDEVVRFGNARRWEHVGPFAAAALGGIGTWQRVAGELFPVLSNAARRRRPRTRPLGRRGGARGDRGGARRRARARPARRLTPHLPSPATSLRSAGCLRSSSASAATSAGRSVSGPRDVAPRRGRRSAAAARRRRRSAGRRRARDRARSRCRRSSPPPRPSPCPQGS